MAEYNFEKDLIVGLEGESKIIKLLENFGGKLISTCNNNKNDFTMSFNNEEILYEVKTDVLVKPKKDTGNIFIEFKSRGKESGISVTKAKWFVTYFKYLNEVWFIQTDKLKELINTNSFKFVTNAGDPGSFTHGYLIPRNKFSSYFKIYKITDNN